MPTLHITGDDFGLNSEVNEMIDRDFQAGILTRASLIVGGAAVEEAVSIAARHPKLQVGLHLVLGAGPGVTGIQLPATPLQVGLRSCVSRRFRNVIDDEIRGQISKFIQLGFPAGHWDGHCHLHLHPVIFDLATEKLHAAGFRSVRLLLPTQGQVSLLSRIFGRLSQRAQSRQPRFESTSCTLGLEVTGQVTTDVFLKLLDQVFQQTGNAEIYYHPGAEPAPLEIARVREKLRAMGGWNRDPHSSESSRC